MSEVKLNDSVAEELKQRYPSNSVLTKREQQPEKEKVKPVVEKGVAVLQKESLCQKVKKMFIPSDVQDVKTYVVEQILIPGVKDGILSVIELMFYGRTSRRIGSGPLTQARTNYSYISSNGQKIGQAQTPQVSQKDRAIHNFKNVVYPTYQDAEDVISTLIDLVDRYGQATVADFYDASGIEADWASDNWGWRSFNKLESRKVREGYVIDMTQPIYLK